jgi:hypothetical protein
MGDVYKDIDFERMLSDLGQALERNTAAPGTQPAQQPPAAAAPAAPGVPTAAFPDVKAPYGMQPGVHHNVMTGQDMPFGMSPNTHHNVMTGQDDMSMAPPAAPPPAGGMQVAGGAPSPYSPQDLETLAALQNASSGAVAFGGGHAPPAPAMPPPSPLAAQLAGASAAPNAMSAPPTQYPNIDPNAAGGLAGYAALR